MSKWIKIDKYHATNGKYTMSWNDVKKFILHWNNDFVESGSREKCLEAFNNYRPVQEQTQDEWLADYNKPTDDQ